MKLPPVRGEASTTTSLDWRRLPQTQNLRTATLASSANGFSGPVSLLRKEPCGRGPIAPHCPGLGAQPGMGRLSLTCYSQNAGDDTHVRGFVSVGEALR